MSKQMPEIDRTLPFMPERLTPLYHSEVYATLSTAQRLRYNQLQSCCHNELTTFFEVSLAHTFLPALLARGAPEPLASGLRTFAADEERHIEMFQRLNRRCFPNLYAHGDFHFVQMSPVASAVLRWITRQSRLFPMFAWLMLIQEERSAYYANEVLAEAGALEPHFVRTHRAHLADETGHVDWDLDIIDFVWRRAPQLIRSLNARILGWMLENFFCAPRRAALRVLDALIDEFPDLAPRKVELRQALLDLGRAPDYRLTLYSRAIVPKTYAGFDRWPEFACLSQRMPGYRPQPALGVPA